VAARRVRIRISGLGEDANLHGVGYLAWQSATPEASSSATYENSHQLSAKKLKKKLPSSAHVLAR
jgi:hypothetical protein